MRKLVAIVAALGFIGIASPTPVQAQQGLGPIYDDMAEAARAQQPKKKDAAPGRSKKGKRPKA